MIMKDIITDNYKLLHGDCLERMKEIPDGSVDNSVGYLPSNCISCCSWCNRAKNNGTLANFVDKCKKITSRIELDDNYFDIGAERMRNHIKNE